VEAQGAGAERRPDRGVALEPGIGLHRAAASRRDVADVELARRVLVEARGLGGDDAEDNAPEVGGTAEVLGEALEHHLLVAAPRPEAEGARAHRMAREAGAAPVRP